MLTAAARSFLITTSLICSGALLSACGSSSNPEIDDSGASSSSSSSEASSKTPNAFSFEDKDDVELGAEVTSNPVVIEGMDEPVAIEISGGEYAINGTEPDDFTNERGDIEAGDELTLRTQAPDSANQVHEVTVTIGGVSGLWRVSTPEDTEAPQAAFAFPTPMSATDAETLTLRGTASDELSQIDAVTLTVIDEDGSTQTHTVESDDGFATWTFEVSLAPGNNRIQLGSEDVLGNADDNIAEITVVRQSFDLAFPDNEEPFADISNMTFDKENGRLLVGAFADDRSFGNGGVVVGVDLQTGKRSLFSGSEPSEEVLSVTSVDCIVMDYKRDRVLVGTAHGELITIDLSSRERALLAGPEEPSDDEPTFRRPVSALLDPEDDDFVYVVSPSDSRLLRLDLNNGQRRVVAGDDIDGSSIGEGRTLFYARAVVIGPDGDFAYLIDERRESAYRLNLGSGDREDLDMEGYPNALGFGFYMTDVVSASDRSQFYVADRAEGLVLYNIESASWELVSDLPIKDRFGSSRYAYMHMALDGDNQKMFLVDRNSKALIAFDLQTEEYVLVSKSANVDDD